MKFYLFLALIISPIFIVAQTRSSTINWQQQLPPCPCRNPDFDSTVLHDGWAKDKGNIKKYHAGAAASFRSYPPVRTSEGLSGQQCCYDSNGNLITSGRGAGTPDKVGVCKGENKKGYMKSNAWRLIGHYSKDVRPWARLMKKDSSGWKTYNKTWIPNNSNNCNVNVTE